jgi:hypothetical protein
VTYKHSFDQKIRKESCNENFISSLLMVAAEAEVLHEDPGLP